MFEYKFRSAISKMLWICFLALQLMIKQTLASGVLELELIDLRRLDAVSGAAGKTASDHDEAPFRLIVCLKEAFASQLDGPCAFGNASLSLYRPDPSKLSRVNKFANFKAVQEGDEETARGQSLEHQSSQMTNVVRIPFSFRWTKAFTIVLTAERQVAADGERTRTSDGAEVATNRSQSAASANQQQHQTEAGFALIDRHVLTENEVLPSWAAANKAAWTTRFSRNFKTSLVYRFRILCAANHYGDDCSTFCRPRDDQFGHFQCSQNGQKLCMDGWQGADCALAKCRAGCNKQHGFCDRPDTCQCRPGWTGARCDECLTYPGCQNGFCLAPWQCVCQPNWAGFLCDQDLNYCATHAPCENNATCQNAAPGRYKCHCPAGFTGLNCQLRLATLVDLTSAAATALSTRLHAAGCSQNPCLNGGACLRMMTTTSQQQLATVPRPTASDRLQQQQQLDDTVEVEEIQTILSNRSYRCQCQAGFTGDYCQWAELPPLRPVDEPSPASAGLDFGAPADNQTAGRLAVGASPAVELETMLPSLELMAETAPSEPPLNQTPRSSTTLEMRHLISGVVVASAIGVFCAALLLAWCCLLAIESGKFQLVQMNFIRSDEMDPDGTNHGGLASSLRRVQAKIRNSFRRSARTSIKPATKLSLENVLNPARLAPPSYEESNHNQTTGEQLEIAQEAFSRARRHQESINSTGPSHGVEHLVKRGALEQEIALKCQKHAQSIQPLERELASCPKHAHLYRNLRPHLDASTTIEIEYKPPDDA